MSNGARLLFLVPVCVVLASGCTKGNRSANATVSGKVMYNNAPVTGGTLLFHAEGAGLTPVLIKPDGTFVGTDLPVDKEVTVTVETEILNPNKAKADYGAAAGHPGGGVSPMPAGTPTGSGGAYVKIPHKYTDKTTSTLKKTLKSGNQTWDLELTD
jgi:hypothetical protein